ncbi:MAG: calcium-binding protein [Pseudomonadota bacterium]
MATLSTTAVFPTVLAGTANADTINGSSAADIIDGGAGNDLLNGKAGSDTYLFGRLSGSDTISESADFKASTDAVLFDPDVAQGDLMLQRDGASDTLLVRIKGASNVLTIKNYFDRDGAASPYAIEEFRFFDGAVWTRAMVNDMVLQPTAGNDTIVGYFSDDVLDGGAGNDRLDGRGGSDTYKFGRLSGNDTISESPDFEASTDVLLLDADVAPGDVSLQRDGTSDTLLLRIKGANNVLTIKNYFDRDGAASPYAIEEIRFAGGAVWDRATVMAMVIQPTAGSDTIVGYHTNDVLDGGAGNDWLDGRGGSDTYHFGRLSGNDTISQSADYNANTDTVLLDAGIAPGDLSLQRDGTTDTLLVRIKGTGNVLTIRNYFDRDGAASAYALEEIRFADGAVWDRAAVMKMVIQPTAGNDTIVGYHTNDVLDGGAGNDWLDGRGGSDIYKFGRTSGSDTISESADYNANVDAVQLCSCTYPSDVLLQRDGTGEALILRIKGTTSVLTIRNYFDRDGAPSPYAVEEIRFANGVVWDRAAVMKMVIQPTAGNDTIVGYYSNDVLDGGMGNDWFDGRGGSDVYKFGIGSGKDTIAESGDYDANTDAVLLSAGIDAGSLTLTRPTGSDTLVLGIAGTQDTLTIKNYFYRDGVSYYAVEQIRFDDGAVWTPAMVKAMMTAGLSGAAMQGVDAAEHAALVGVAATEAFY